MGPVDGTSFAVWAPAARGVTVVGDFDGWSGQFAPMRVLGSTGVWELFLPDIAVGSLYKFRVHGHGRLRSRQGRSHGIRYRGPAGDCIASDHQFA